MDCIACGRGLHRECRTGCKRCHGKTNVPGESAETEQENAPNFPSNLEPRVPKKSNLKDPESTGRKRAARLYKIDPDSPCEWRGRKNCGGGLRPIVGCYEGNQQHLHHGPVKRTTRNELGNVHRICTGCHVHWHELNDLIYDEANFDLLPHDPIRFCEAHDLWDKDCVSCKEGQKTTIENILKWKSGEMGKLFPLASSQNHKKGDSDGGE